jgi:hypothetical protein
MENVDCEGVYPCMHNHSTSIFSRLQGENFYGLSLLNLKWMKKWKSKAGTNQFSQKTTVKEDNKFNDSFRGNIITVM